jgi:hypothetical protein
MISYNIRNHESSQLVQIPENNFVVVANKTLVQQNQLKLKYYKGKKIF